MNYKRTDKVIAIINRRLIKLFSRLKSVIAIDKLNILSEVNSTYKQIEKLFREMFYELIKADYEAEAKAKRDRLLYETWIDELVEEYDPVSKYVFENELDRKRARLFEALMSSNTPSKEVDAALRSVSLMGKAEAVEVTDKAVIKAFKDNGVIKIRWHSEHDNRVCFECLDRDGKIYDIDKIPDKPHPNCRCWFEAVR